MESELRSELSFQSFENWLNSATNAKRDSVYGGDSHSLTLTSGEVLVEHDYQLHPPARVEIHEFKALLKAWHDYLALNSGS